MELKWLEDFIALNEQGSFSKAAQSRFVTQPAFSRRIRALENWLGVDLVDRERYPTTLTKEGEDFVSIAQNWLTQVYVTQSQLQQQQKSAQQITLSVQHSLAVTYLPKFLAPLNEINPHTTVKVNTGDLHDCFDELMSGRADFMLSYYSHHGFPNTQNPNLVYLELGEDSLVPVSLVNEQGKQLHSINGIHPLKLINYPADAFTGRIVQSDCLPQIQSKVRTQTVLENALVESVKALVLAGHGVAWVPHSIIEKELVEQRLKLVTGLPSAKMKIRVYCLNPERTPEMSNLWRHLSSK
ncbi:LysR family transcriptional regulator [Vibrio penaeicida]|uniref:LysR family transcriptional regulator n=1 Tax=Vibrio penaeicida TaxID=104609 RepID=A0AAV5P0E6_9VIBR|nr:LysR substrate-binding domain-containing protein [Vibrio penaeicida]GLQ76068.1 LysR family transcriptional regulator [Vibrio penaeicida]